MSWHESAILAIAAVAAERKVEQVWVFGSAASSELDEWSDLDVALVTPHVENANLGWLSGLGTVWAYEVAGNTTRVVLKDGRRIDLVVVPNEDAIPGTKRKRIEVPPADDAPRAAKPEEVPALVNEFRFLAVQAVVKAARHDLLIGTHLALELPRRCLVLAMMLRDREVGTTVHRFGGPRNDLAARALGAAAKPDGILTIVSRARDLFDELATEYWPTYQPDWSPLQALTDHFPASAVSVSPDTTNTVRTGETS
ncbi:nucleotidyltransferase domain-containing protein [Tenggerimyces flavus]|uniref:Nucleotidyltransferase domain-containing protein n=1 Tax=Tenggerimyces flavus TaxID=1708749 RepID=A0ABV7YNU0_9ACTN|nr:nucleotidyltransferase domain-containing protein [Tenggerimyces flavus]MBM7786487.1 putative nucleotidyltransferase [Tenggerimyces flavus]